MAGNNLESGSGSTNFTRKALAVGALTGALAGNVSAEGNSVPDTVDTTKIATAQTLQKTRDQVGPLRTTLKGSIDTQEMGRLTAPLFVDAAISGDNKNDVINFSVSSDPNISSTKMLYIDSTGKILGDVTSDFNMKTQADGNLSVTWNQPFDLDPYAGTVISFVAQKQTTDGQTINQPITFVVDTLTDSAVLDILQKWIAEFTKQHASEYHLPADQAKFDAALQYELSSGLALYSNLIPPDQVARVFKINPQDVKIAEAKITNPYDTYSQTMNPDVKKSGEVAPTDTVSVDTTVDSVTVNGAGQIDKNGVRNPKYTLSLNGKEIETNTTGKFSGLTPNTLYQAKIYVQTLNAYTKSWDSYSVVHAANTIEAKTTPNDFVVQKFENVGPSSQVYSNPITISGTNYPSPISVSATNGVTVEYALVTDSTKNVDPSQLTYTSAPGKIAPGGTFILRITGNGSYGFTSEGTFAIGGLSKISVITGAPAPVINNPPYVPPVDSTNPVATGETVTTAYNTAKTGINVLANDTDNSGTVLLGNITNQVGGTFTKNGNTIDFTPTPGFSGNASCTYQVKDPTGNSATAVLTITVSAAPNANPTAFDITNSVNQAKNTVFTTNAITVAGTNIPSTATTTQGTLVVNGTDTTLASTTVNAGDTVAVKLTTPNTDGATMSGTLTIGTTVDSYSISTLFAAPTGTLNSSNTYMNSANYTSVPISVTSAFAGDVYINGTATGSSVAANGTYTANLDFSTDVYGTGTGPGVKTLVIDVRDSVTGKKTQTLTLSATLDIAGPTITFSAAAAASENAQAGFTQGSVDFTITNPTIDAALWTTIVLPSPSTTPNAGTLAAATWGSTKPTATTLTGADAKYDIWIGSKDAAGNISLSKQTPEKRTTVPTVSSEHGIQNATAGSAIAGGSYFQFSEAIGAIVSATWVGPDQTTTFSGLTATVDSTDNTKVNLTGTYPVGLPGAPGNLANVQIQVRSMSGKLMTLVYDGQQWTITP